MARKNPTGDPELDAIFAELEDEEDVESLGSLEEAPTEEPEPASEPEAASEPEPASVQVPEQPPQQQQGEGDTRTALYQTREELRQLKAQFEREKAQFLQQQQRLQEPEPEPEPTFNEPEPVVKPREEYDDDNKWIAALSQQSQWEKRRDRFYADLQTKRLEQLEQERRMERIERELDDAMAGYGSRVVQEHPDYPQALNHLKDVVFREAQINSLMDPQQAAKATMQQLRGAVYMARQRGIDPAEHLYAIAQHRGWNPYQQMQYGQQPPAQQTPQQQPQPAPRQPVRASPAAQAEGNLASVPSSDAPTSLQKFLTADDRAFKDMDEELIIRLMGRS